MPSPKPKSLVVDATDWRHVLDRYLSDCPDSEKAIKLLTKLKGDLSAFLAPICAAWSVTQDASIFKRNEILRIAVLGAESGDTGLDGRLYSLLPWLLGKPNIQVEIELVGPSLKIKSRAKAIDAIGLPAAKLYKTTCGNWWKERKRRGQLPDLLIAFHPGLEGHTSEWMAPDELPQILASGIPLVIFSYDLDEAERDAEILTSCGARIATSPRVFPLAVNSYSNEPASPPITFAGATFSVAGFEAKPMNWTLIEEIGTLSKAVADVHSNEGLLERHSDAFRPCFIYRGDKVDAVRHVFGRIYFDPNKKELFIAIRGVEVRGIPPVAAAKVWEAMTGTVTALDRARLAAKIYLAFTGTA